jgi:hypothetical protein
MFYATLDTVENYRAAEGAYIVAFETREQAEAYLRDTYAEYIADQAEIDEPVTMTVEPAQWSDCWIKTYLATTITDGYGFGPFAADDLYIQAPGQHPGGNEFWITPMDDVLVAVFAEAT